MSPSVFLIAIPVLVALSAFCCRISRPKIWLAQLLLAGSLLCGILLLTTVPRPTTVSATFSTQLQNVSFGLTTDLLKATVVCLVLIATLVLLTQLTEESGAICLYAFASVLAIQAGTTTTLLAALCVVVLGRLLTPGTSGLTLLLSSAAVAIWFGCCVSLLNVAKTTSFSEVVPQELSAAVAFFWSLVAALWILSTLGERSRWVTIFATTSAVALIINLNDIGLGTQNNTPVVLVGAVGCVLAVWGLRRTALGIVVAAFMVVTEEISVAGADASDALGLAAVALLALAVVGTNNRWLPWRTAAYSCSLLLLAVSFATSYSSAVTSRERFWLVPVLGLSGMVVAVLATDRLRRFLASTVDEATLWKGLISGAAGVAVACWAARFTSGGGLNSFDFLSVNSVGDGFAFGYLALGLLVLAALSWAVLVLAEIKVAPESSSKNVDEVQTWQLDLDRRLANWYARAAHLFSRFDDFMVGQPRLATVVLAVLVYLVLVR